MTVEADARAKWEQLCQQEPRLARLLDVAAFESGWDGYERMKSQLKRILLDSELPFEPAYPMALNRIAWVMGL